MSKYKKVLMGFFGCAVVAAAFLCGKIAGTLDKSAAAISIIGGADGPTSVFLAGKVGGGESTEADAAQELYNRCGVARAYADEQIQAYLESFDSDYSILETSYGFYTSEAPVYVVGYRCSNGAGGNFNYAYKISVAEDLNCTTLEDGQGVAEFLFETEENGR